MEYGTDQKCVFGARKIQAYWRCYQDRRLFQLLLETVRAAENCLAPTVLRLLSPIEADLLKDPSMHCEVRFRFSGSKFPPVIVFKIFHLGGGGQYISGKRVFRPNNFGTTDTRRMLGSRIFLNHILADEIQRQGRTVVDTSDVTCMRDYMQYTSHVDELPAYLGGRENTWRSLSLKGLPQRGTATDRFQQKCLLSLWRDGGQNPRLQRSPATPPSSIVSTERSVLNPTPLFPICHSSRKCSTTHRMRRLHLLQNKLGEEDNNGEWRTMGQDVDSQENNSLGGFKESVSTRMAAPLVEEKGSSDVSFSEWEEEADELYTWTKQLDISDIDTVPYLQEKTFQLGLPMSGEG